MPRWIERLAHGIGEFAAITRSGWVMVIADAVFIPFALWCAISLRLGPSTFMSTAIFGCSGSHSSGQFRIGRVKTVSRGHIRFLAGELLRL